jgi:hypothetical protein
MSETGRRALFSGLIASFLLLPFLERGGAVAAQEAYRSVCGSSVHVDEAEGWIWLPQGRLFCPLAADPKAERSFVTYLRGDFSTLANPPAGDDTNIGAVGLGDSFALFRFGGGRPGNGVQLDVAGAVFSQFNLDEPSFDLINADYVIGLPLTMRRGGFTSRLRLYHQSSHLGDEFILNREPERINLSFEALELILSQEAGRARVYAGGEAFFRREPEDLAEHLVHAGAEVRPAIFMNGRLVAAVDFKAVKEDEWSGAWSARAGLEIARIPSPGHPAEVIAIYVEYYDGVAPYGQFYREDIRYWGFGVQVFG